MGRAAQAVSAAVSELKQKKARKAKAPKAAHVLEVGAGYKLEGVLRQTVVLDALRSALAPGGLVLSPEARAAAEFVTAKLVERQPKGQA